MGWRTDEAYEKLRKENEKKQIAQFSKWEKIQYYGRQIIVLLFLGAIVLVLIKALIWS